MNTSNKRAPVEIIAVNLSRRNPAPAAEYVSKVKVNQPSCITPPITQQPSGNIQEQPRNTLPNTIPPPSGNFERKSYAKS